MEYKNEFGRTGEDHTERVGGDERIEEVVRELGLQDGQRGEHRVRRLGDVREGDGQTEGQSLGLTPTHRKVIK